MRSRQADKTGRLAGRAVMVRVAFAAVCVACAVMASFASAPRVALAHLELPPAEAKKLYPKFPTDAVGTTDAAKKQLVPKEFTPTDTTEDALNENRGNSLDVDRAIPTTLSELVAASKRLDGRMVSFKGEAIGDVIDASGGMKWVLVEEDGAGLSVLMNEEQAKSIVNLGRYGIKGSLVEVTGVYHIADIEQAGELDVRAYQLKVLEPGGPVETPLHLWKLVVGMIFLVGAVALGLVYRYLRKRSL